MSTTLRVGSALLPGYFHVGDRGLGVLASSIPATGAHGPAIAYPGLALPADAGKEVIASILTVPPSLTYLDIDELGRVVAEGPLGTHVGTYRLYLDGVDSGSSTYTVQIGGGDISGDAGLGGVAVGGGAVADSGLLSGDANTGGPSVGGGGVGQTAAISGGVTLDGPAVSGSGSSNPSGTLAGDVALDGVQIGGGGSAPSGDLGGGVQLDGPAVGGGATSVPSSTLSGDMQGEGPTVAGGGTTPSGLASGDVRLDDGAAGGGMGVQQPTILGGDMQGGDGALSGGVQGYQEPVAVIGYRFVDVAVGTTPKHLAPLDVAEVDDIAFLFGRRLNAGETVQSFAASCSARVGIDPQPSPLLVGGAAKFGSVAMVRVDGSLGVLGVTYLLRVVATLTNGRTITGAAFIKLVRKS